MIPKPILKLGQCEHMRKFPKLRKCNPLKSRFSYFFYKSQAKSLSAARFSLTIDAGRIKEQDKR